PARRSFFFSSRRRHTRFSRDWSSDVCSSDLTLLPRSGSVTARARDRVPVLCMEAHPENEQRSILVFGGSVSMGPWFGSMVYNRQIGRASCRERVQAGGAAVS